MPVCGFFQWGCRSPNPQFGSSHPQPSACHQCWHPLTDISFPLFSETYRFYHRSSCQLVSISQRSAHAAQSTIQLLTLLLSAPLDGQTCPLALCMAIACQLSTDGAGWSSPRSGNLCLSVPFCLQRLNLVSFPISQLLMCHVSSPNVVVHRDAAYRQLALLSPSVGE